MAPPANARSMSDLEILKYHIKICKEGYVWNIVACALAEVNAMIWAYRHSWWAIAYIGFVILTLYSFYVKISIPRNTTLCVTGPNESRHIKFRSYASFARYIVYVANIAEESIGLEQFHTVHIKDAKEAVALLNKNKWLLKE